MFAVLQINLRNLDFLSRRGLFKQYFRRASDEKFFVGLYTDFKILFAF